jgi:azobenzene reductase
MKYVIISTSHRKESNSIKLSSFLKEELIQQEKNADIEILDLATAQLPFWDDRMWEKTSNPLKEKWAPISQMLQMASGFILVIPEWNGMTPAALHNFFLFCSTRELGHKPALIVSLSTGIGGAYPVAEIRSIGYKNTGICYMPSHLIYRYVQNFLDKDKAHDQDIIMMRKRTEMTLGLFRTYCKNFENIRKEDCFDYKKFPHGM